MRSDRMRLAPNASTSTCGWTASTRRLSGCGLGASQADFQPGVCRWRLLLDPDVRGIRLSPPPATTP